MHGLSPSLEMTRISDLLASTLATGPLYSPLHEGSLSEEDFEEQHSYDHSNCTQEGEDALTYTGFHNHHANADFLV